MHLEVHPQKNRGRQQQFGPAKYLSVFDVFRTFYLLVYLGRHILPAGPISELWEFLSRTVSRQGACRVCWAVGSGRGQVMVWGEMDSSEGDQRFPL